MLAVLPCQVEHTEGEDGNDHGENPALEIDTSISSEHKLEASEVQKIHDLYEGIQDKSVPVSDIAESKELIKLQECLLKYKTFLAEKSLTAKLWLQYIECVETLKLFIQAERTEDWNLHLIAVEEMLNLLVT